MQLLFELVLLFACGLILYYMRQGAIYLPTHPRTVEMIVAMVNIQPGVRAVDLGSGDGRLVIALAQAGALAHGFEVNPILAIWSKLKIKKLGLQNNAKIFVKSFWGQDLSQYDVVIVFGMTHIMDRLETKLKKELKPEALVISNVFQFKGLKLVNKDDSGVYVYKV